MGHLPTKKPYLTLSGQPVLTHTVRAFDHCTAVDAIWLIVCPTDMELCQRVVVNPYAFQKFSGYVDGGATRQASVFNGLRALPSDTDYVVVHDGVRPFVSQAVILACLEAASEYGASSAAVPVKDTIKRTDDEGFVLETPDRSKLWAVQTPQAFRRDLLLEAHEKAIKEGIVATDDAALVEQLGVRVKLVRGSYHNIKITTPDDLVIAEAFCRLESERV